MKTLKEIINDWLQVNQDLNTARLRYFQKRHDILLQSTEWKMERASLITSQWDDSDKEVITEFYDMKIDQCANDLYWLDLFWDLKIVTL